MGDKDKQGYSIQLITHTTLERLRFELGVKKNVVDVDVDEVCGTQFSLSISSSLEASGRFDALVVVAVGDWHSEAEAVLLVIRRVSTSRAAASSSSRALTTCTDKDG